MMRYRVEIAAGWNAAQVIDNVASLHGSWDSAVSGVGGQSGVAFVRANDGEDDDLTDAMDDHDGVVEYLEL